VISLYGIVFFFFLTSWDYLIRDLHLIKLSQSFYTFLEYSFFAYILWSGISNKNFRKIILLLSIFFFLFQVIFFISTTRGRLDTVPVGIETILLLVFIFLFFYEHFIETKNEYIYHNHCFWIALGILIYLGGSFFFNILANDLEQGSSRKYWYLTYIAEIIKNILFSVAIIMYARKTGNNVSKQSSVPYLDMI